MAKRFNTTGICIPRRHYMVDIEPKLAQIKLLIDDEAYFTINRGRQYGKTTTLSELEKYLADEYIVISLSFEGLGSSSFVSEEVFCQKFLENISIYMSIVYPSEVYSEEWKNESAKDFDLLSRHITTMCKEKKIVLMIDEVDKASNYRVFLDFLNTLRNKFISRAKDRDFTFHSVILAGVYDIKNIKLKMVDEGIHMLASGEKEQNSPWNIAEKFKVEMSFPPQEIAGMLSDYELDHSTGMDIESIAEEIYFYTRGYPVLVSNICRYIDEELKKTWNLESVQEAVRRLVREIDNELFKSLSQNLERNEAARSLLYDVLILGIRRSFSMDNPTVSLAYRYGYIQEVNECVKISNKIFEMRMTSYFVSKDEERLEMVSSGGLIAEITRGEKFNMQLCLERFLIHWQEMYSEKDVKFIEKQCRIIFLTYLKPLLNGNGFYFIETTLTDDRRLDLVVTYGKERFVLELKTWKGKLYNEKGVGQLLGYMNKLGEDKGYLLTFDFRKNPKPFEPQWRNEDEKEIFEVRV